VGVQARLTESLGLAMWDRTRSSPWNGN